ncbi:hypothetical protein [Cryptosporangium phraense]|uniref:Uncharacterized protein n=1 Tax=Cryptosporangium phraense TaxID=2593070 RepID=A0A545AGB4_9ACTN|nr:hypothetical protein [Cryptosporangium phraense]TQS40362.1 hypothetical protein FL583_35105 [Cryptosporangium phraense]
MIRVVGMELRRSSALGAALLIALAGLVTLYATPQRWSTGWMSLAMTQREYLSLLSPLAMAAGAWQSYREHRAKVAELFRSVPRPQPQRIVPILAATGVAVALAYLVSLAGALPRIAGGYLPGAVVAVTAVGLVAMIASVWIGLAVGRLVPALATAPAIAVADFALQVFAPHAFDDPGLFAAFSPSMGMSQFSAYDTVAGAVSVAQAVWVTALAVAAVVLLAARRRRTGLAALLPLAVGAAATLLVVPTGDEYDKGIVDPVAQQLVCDGPVCVSRVHAPLLPSVEPRARHALGLLASVPGVRVTSAHEDTSTVFPPTEPEFRADTALMEVAADAHGGLAHPARLETSLITSAFVGPSDCLTTVNNYLAAHAVAFWLLGSDAGLGFGDPEAVAIWKRLRDAPDAAARVSAAYRAAQECRDAAAVLGVR